MLETFTCNHGFHQTLDIFINIQKQMDLNSVRMQLSCLACTLPFNKKKYWWSFVCYSAT